MNSLKQWIVRNGLGNVALLALVLLVAFPLALDLFRLNLVGKYLSYSFVALGLVMLWGYGGVLSLGQGVFFGLGGYGMAMFLKLEASDPITTKIQSTPGIPDFMDWNQITALPIWWKPFQSFPLTLLLILVVPTLLAFIIGYAMFKRRVGGVYFAIITQAVALILTVLIIGQQGYTGGVNGMTDLKTILGWDTRTDSAKYILYFVTVGLLLGAIVLCTWIQKSKLGTLLLAMRDKEDRVPLLGLRRGHVPGLRLLLRGHAVGRGRRHVHPAGRLHVAVAGRHRALHRDGDLRRRGRAHVAGGRGLRRAAGELRQDLFFRELPRPLAVPDGRRVPGRGAGLPRRPGRRLHAARSSPGWPGASHAARKRPRLPLPRRRRRPVTPPCKRHTLPAGLTGQQT